MSDSHASSCPNCHRSAPPDWPHLQRRIDDLIDFEKAGDRWDSVTVLMQVRDWLEGIARD